MKNLYFLIFFCVGFILITSCSKDDDNDSNENNVDNISFMDKWWYDSNDVAADIYFYSNGNYQQEKIVSGQEYTATGNWTWLDEGAGIIKINNIEGDNQTVTEVWVKISDKQNHSFKLEQSLDGMDYYVEVFYIDTND
jgi:hypothetical protein